MNGWQGLIIQFGNMKIRALEGSELPLIGLHSRENCSEGQCGVGCKLKCVFQGRFLKYIYELAISMLHLDDLIHHEDSCMLVQADSDAKETYLPELKEIGDHHPSQDLLDPFLDHLPQSPQNLVLPEVDVQKEGSPSEEQPSSSVLSRKTRRSRINKNRNETKNIPKNFGKGIISFIERNKSRLESVVNRYGFGWERLMEELRGLKKKINTIAELRELWTGEKGTCMRVLSNLFFREYALEYIFNSRISSYGSHIKYRSSLWQALKEPHTFNSIKHY